MDRIETGVDRLVELINSEKKISIEEAAKKLGISKIVIQEWGEFLEEEKLITMEYKFSKTFLMERKLSEKEIKVKEKEYSSEKDAFVRKIESSLKNLENDSLGLENIKSEFNKLKEEIGSEIIKVQSEVKDLEKYEYLKKNLDTDIEKQVEEFHELIDKAHKDLDIEQKKHHELIEQLDIEKREIQVKEHRLSSLEEKESNLLKRTQEILETSKEISKRAQFEKTSIIDSERKVRELGKAVNDIELNINKKRKYIQPMLNKAKKHEEHILKLQDEILTKAKEKTFAIKSQIIESQKVTDNFQKFFDKKNQVGELIQKIEDEKDDIMNDFKILEKKALAFDLSSKSDTVGTHMKSLEKNLNEVNKKRNTLKENLEKLIKFVKG